LNVQRRALGVATMKFQIDDERAGVQLRKIGLQLAISGLRIVEEYRRVYGDDNDRVMIILAVVASTLERAIRGDENGEFSDLRFIVPDDQIGPCNIASISVATGLPRETARRKVNALIAEGILSRDRRGVITFVKGIGQNPVIYRMLRRQAGEIARLASVFSEAGIMVPISSTPLSLVEDDKRAA
jgi:hypothetical protein